jgi:hypothetical protein
MQLSLNPAEPTPRLPAFLVLGTQKGGTTTLFSLLSQHPQVHLPACKEVHYFSLHHGQGPAWYAQHFSAAREDQLCGDITPYYLFHPQAPARIQALIPEARLVILLRDPVERALSHYFHAVRHGFETLELGAALAAEGHRLANAEATLARQGVAHFSHQKHSYKSRGRYRKQIEAYRCCFTDHQILVLKSEDLFHRPLWTWTRLLGFLQLDSVPLPAHRADNRGGGEASSVPTFIREQLREEFACDVAFVRATYGFDWGW